jgi:hypothetical protein
MPDEWKQISDLYLAALKLPENERAAFLQMHRFLETNSYVGIG